MDFGNTFFDFLLDLLALVLFELLNNAQAVAKERFRRILKADVLVLKQFEVVVVVLRLFVLRVAEVNRLNLEAFKLLNLLVRPLTVELGSSQLVLQVRNLFFLLVHYEIGLRLFTAQV